MLHRDTMAVLMELPLVKTLLSEKNRLSRKCKTLREENKALRNLIRSLPEFRCAHYAQPTTSVPIKTESSQSHVPMQCEPLVDSDEVVYIEQPDQNKHGHFCCRPLQSSNGRKVCRQQPRHLG
jgi:hypothetical protein